MKDRTWPVDVAILTPTSRNAFSDRVPCVWFSLEEAVAWCYAAAGNLPFGTLRPETLVWKLAACVQFAATGDDASRRDHIFVREDLPVLFEQLVDQLQEFPSAPLEYRPQADEPVFVGDEQTRLIVGFSGAGKTAWASWQAQHSSAACAYFDVVDPQGSALAKALARELAARFVIDQPESAALFPAFSGIEALQCLNGRLRPDKAPVVVMDNVHRVEPEEIKRVISACSNIRFILLGRPGSNATRLAAMMEIEVECLKGWDADTVASVFATEGSVIGPGTAKNWQLTTGGLPLYVKNSAQLCYQRYEGNAEVFLKEVSHGNHLDELAQESILRMTIKNLSRDEASLVAVMSLANLRLSPSEIKALADALPSPPQQLASIHRFLQRKGLIQIYTNGDRKLHDALHLPALGLLDGYSNDQLHGLRVRLRDVLRASLSEKWDVARFGAWLRLLAPTGHVETLVDLATTDMFHQIGEPSELKDALIATADDETIDDTLRYWTLDALTFWELQADNHERNPEPYLERLSQLLASNPLSIREQSGFHMKQMVYAGMQGDRKTVDSIFDATFSLSKDDVLRSRLLRYNYAVALFYCGHLQDSLHSADALCAEYYAHFDLNPKDLTGISGQRLIRLLPGALADHEDDLKRLGDCLDLTAKCLRQLGRNPIVMAIQAAKFYQISRAYRSEMKAAQDVADDMLNMGDAIGARQVLETHVLPLLAQCDFNSRALDVRGQYALILAYCGEHERARSEIKNLMPYIPHLPIHQQTEVAGLCSRIEDIAAGRMPLPSPTVPPICNQSHQRARKQKIGRNDPCPCGSGRKYKKCCGQ